MNKVPFKFFSSLVFIIVLILTFSCKIETSENKPKTEETPVSEAPTPAPVPETPAPSPESPVTQPPAEIYYTITFNSNNQAATGSTASIRAKADTTVTLTANGFSLEGYTFTGWNTVADGTGTGYTDGASLKLSADITLYAQWVLVTVPTYLIKINQAAHGTITSSRTISQAGVEISITVTPDELYALDTLVVNDSLNNSIHITANQTDPKIFTFTMPESIVTVNATFKYIAHSITIMNGENGSASLNKTKAIAGNEITITVFPDENYVLNTLTIESTDGQFVTTTMDSNNTNLYTFVMPDQDVSIITTYKLRSYTVSFITDCSEQIPPQIVERNSKANYVPMSNNAECRGFLGWYTEPECINQFDFNNNSITQDIFLYAKWESFIFRSDNIVQKISSLLYSCKLECWIDYNGNYQETFDINKIQEITDAMKTLYLNSPELTLSLDFRCSIMADTFSFKDCKNLAYIFLPQKKDRH